MNIGYGISQSQKENQTKQELQQASRFPTVEHAESPETASRTLCQEAETCRLTSPQAQSLEKSVSGSIKYAKYTHCDKRINLP